MIGALSVLFALGAIIATLTAVALRFPGRALDAIWRLNPEAHIGFLSMGSGAIVLMIVVAVACTAGAAGLWLRARWGRTLAIALLAFNLLANLATALLRGDPRTLIGVPIAGALIAYLSRAEVRSRFRTR